MADIKVVIQLQDTVERDEIKSLESPTDVSNASINKTGEQFNTLSTKSNGANLKSWATGSLSLADGYVGGANTQLIEQYGYNGYVFGAVPESKQLTVTLEVIGKHIDSIIVYGDKTANQFPTKAYRDGNPKDIIYSDDPVWAIKFDQKSTSHTITFLEWNRTNYNACITYVAELENELTLDKSSIKSVESLSQSTGQPKKIYYGVTPSSGNIEVLVVNEELNDYISDGIIKNSNLPIQILVNDKICYSHISNDSDYSNNVLSIQNTDILESWANFKIKPKVRNATDNSLFYYFRATMRDFGFENAYIDSMCSNLIRNNMTAQEIMTLIRIPYQYYKSETLLDFINSICNVCQFCVVCDSLGLPKFVNGNPDINKNSIIKIPLSGIFGSPSKSVLVKNKVENVKYNQKTFIKSIKDVCNRTTYLNDEDGNFTVSNLDGGKIIQRGTTPYLCFFVECSDLNSEFIWRTTEADDGVVYPFSGILLGVVDNIPFEKITQVSSITELDSSYRKENYDFYNIQNNCCELTYYRTLTSKTFAIAISLSGIANYETDINQVSVSIMQQCVSLVTEEKTYNEIEDNIYDLPDCEFCSTQTTYNSIDIYSNNNANIINNYNKGISVANITVGCLNLYDTEGNIIKDFSKGEVVEVGDVVRVDKDNNGNSLWCYKDGTPMYWRVTGRNFRKVGVPMIDLELQEVRVVS